MTSVPPSASRSSSASPSSPSSPSLDSPVGSAELAALLPRHLGAQRWFGGPDGPVSIHRLDVLRRTWPALLRVEVESRPVSAALAASRWQLLVGLHPAGERDVEQVGETAVIGILNAGTDQLFAYDALVDPVLALALLNHIAPDVDVTMARPIMSEQSNTSLVYDERWFLKVFRRLHGPNPDAEVPAALAADAFPFVAAPRAVWTVGTDDCAVLQPYLHGASEGWALALASLRDLLGGDASLTPALAGGDFAPEAGRLGVLTADLHRAMAAAFGTVPGDPTAWAADITERMATVAHPDIDSARTGAVVAAMRRITDAGKALRVHGDYHLGQVLYSDEGWFVVDFEGEPNATATARAERSSPLRDVAGMLRSFHYAASVAAGAYSEDVTARAYAWEDHNRRAFLSGYHNAIAASGLAPLDPSAFAALLAALELDKAVYEVGYEMAHRPDWVQIPLAGIRRLVGPP